MFYSAIVLSKCEVKKEEYKTLFQENVVLIEATSEEQAMEKAKEYGEGTKNIYKNENGEDVVWNFVEVVDVQEILNQDLKNGTEIYYRHFRDIDSYKKFDSLVNKKLS